jgi:hypothetical protein
MDAQNAASRKHSASPEASNVNVDQQKKAVTKPPSVARSSPSTKDSKALTPLALSRPNDDDSTADGQSEAETIVLPGKLGQSPTKSRKVIKHEDKSDSEINASPSVIRKTLPLSNQKSAERSDKIDGGRAAPSSPGSLTFKKKRLHDLPDKQRSKDGSSGLSSAPTSPPSHQRRRQPSNGSTDSDTDSIGPKSPKPSSRDKVRALDKLVPHKRKAARAESDDEGESRKARRQRMPSTGDGQFSARSNKDHRASSKSHAEPHQSSHDRSLSPQLRTHRRSISTQLPSHSNGMSHKKKRIPAPLQSTDYHSDESSASGSPRARSSKLRSLTTPATTESTISPAKVAPHKKHLDAHGQTFLARACARGEYDHAKQRLADRPEDLNVADFAGNTPLQIAAINGYEDIVKLLLDAGCNLECVNYDKDTPLLDAVDNGHIEVVKLLLDAGVNPRKANVNGEEPLDRVNDDTDNAEEIRAALLAAKRRKGERRLTSEEHPFDQDDSRQSHGPESPRRSPAASSAQAVANARRGGTVRATKTSNHLLYMPMDDKTLRQAAGRGDEETVTRILQVHDAFDDPESMVAAARGGHDVVMQLLLALGNANPDPAPVPSITKELATPMLAAIGQENIKVIRLLLDQNNFDPTRRFQGETYFEIARRRQGANWKDEEQMLKEAYDAYKKTYRESGRTKSPARRDQDRDGKRGGRSDTKEDPGRIHKRKISSPLREVKKSSSGKVATSPKEKGRANSFTALGEDQTSPKRGPGRPRKEERPPAIAPSDREPSPASRHPGRHKRGDSELVAMSSEGESVKPRRKLISGRDLKGERDKNRRASMVSTVSSLKEPSSPHEGRHDEPPDKPRSEKYHDRTKQLKRDESRDRMSVSGDGFGKRHRSSATPPLHGAIDRESGEGPVKRRRLDVDNKEKKQKSGVPQDDRAQKTGPPREPSAKGNQREREHEDRKIIARAKKHEGPGDRTRREAAKPVASERSIHVKSEDMDIDMPDADQPTREADADGVQKAKGDEGRRRAHAESAALEAQKRDDEARIRHEEEDRLRRDEELKRKEDEEHKRKEDAEKKRMEDEKRRREDEEKKRKEDEEKKRKDEEEKEMEKKRREEEERRRREEDEKKRLEEAERIRREDEERKRREDEEKKRREEEERLRKEQLEREAAEAARRKREEEERREKERLQREEAERVRRAAREAEQRRVFEEQERLRLAKLPPLLRWLDKCTNPKTTELARRFSTMQGVRYDCIRPEANGTPEGREQWILNTQVALLLGEKDLELSRYTAWERIPVSMIAKKVIWRLESDRYALTSPCLYDLGRQLPGYYGGENPETASYRLIERLRGEAWPPFSAMDMFFVKVCKRLSAHAWTNS